MNLNFNKDIFERFLFTTVFTALLFFLMVRWWLANHRMSDEKVFILLWKASKLFDIWTPADCLTSCCAMGTCWCLAGGCHGVNISVISVNISIPIKVAVLVFSILILPGVQCSYSLYFLNFFYLKPYPLFRTISNLFYSHIFKKYLITSTTRHGLSLTIEIIWHLPDILVMAYLSIHLPKLTNHSPLLSHALVYPLSLNIKGKVL